MESRSGSGVVDGEGDCVGETEEGSEGTAVVMAVLGRHDRRRVRTCEAGRWVGRNGDAKACLRRGLEAEGRAGWRSGEVVNGERNRQDGMVEDGWRGEYGWGGEDRNVDAY